MNNPRPATPIKPGELLQEELESLGWTQAEFAAIVGRPVQAINEIIAGRKAITADTAVAFSLALGTSPEYWMNLENAYRLDLLHAQQSRLASKPADVIPLRAKLFDKLPINELVKRKWLTVTDPKNVVRLEAAVCKFLEIETIDEMPKAFVARKTDRDAAHTREQLAWVYQARKVAARQRVHGFSAHALRQALPDLPKLSVTEKDTKSIPKHLRDLGIRFVTLRHLPHTRLDGAAFWLDDDSPVVALTLRFDRMDTFWFTLMHELCHVANGDARAEVCLDDNLVGKDAVHGRDAAEQKADEMASEYLVPANHFNAFVRRTSPYFSRPAILEFAEDLGVHPSIVVGRLQYKGLIQWTHHRNMLTRVRHLFEGVT